MSSNPRQSEEEKDEMMDKVFIEARLSIISMKLQPYSRKRKRTVESWLYLSDRLLCELDQLLAECRTSATKEKVKELRNEVMRRHKGLEAKMALNMASSIKSMKRMEVGSSSSSLLEGEVCAICQEAFEVGDAVRVSSCSHQYHEKCICRWLRSSNRCRLCRLELGINSIT